MIFIFRVVNKHTMVLFLPPQIKVCNSYILSKQSTTKENSFTIIKTHFAAEKCNKKVLINY